MQVHTFIAESANEAVDQIRSQLGPEAVVLSVRKLPRSGVSRLLKKEQIEVTAAVQETVVAQPVDPFTQLQAEIRQLREQVARQALSSPVAKTQSAPESPASPVNGIRALLLRAGVLPIFAEQVLANLDPIALTHAPMTEQIELLSRELRRRWTGEPVRSEAGVHVFVGAPGAGKSTVLCKMLAQASLAESQPATVYQLDTLVTNASPQPAVYTEILGAQFDRTCPAQFEWGEQSVFIDLPGTAIGDTRGLEAIKDAIQAFGVPEVHLVLNAAYESAHLLEQARFFSSLGVTDLIVTHLDEEQRWGKLWNLGLGTNYSIRFLSSGQNIPGEFFPASADIILNRQFCGK